MIQYYNGSVFNAKTKAVVNTVNCTGIMGAGLALEFRLRYPEMFKEYEYNCKNHLLKIGEMSYFHEKDITIVNFPTKDYFKYPSKIEWIELGLKNFVNTYKKHSITSIAFPKLGTLNGGLDWDRVKHLMENYLSKVDADVFICLDELKQAEGVELDMVNYFNNNIEIVLREISGMSEQQKMLLRASVPISRFWHLSKFEKIGIKTYSKLFNVCWNAVSDESNSQLTIFDIK